MLGSFYYLLDLPRKCFLGGARRYQSDAMVMLDLKHVLHTYLVRKA